MIFETESTSYEKTILSDLQGAWTNFRDAVAENAGFPGWEKVLFHTDEVISSHNHLKSGQRTYD